jgi:predicted transcriptional regulator of viral defense system
MQDIKKYKAIFDRKGGILRTSDLTESKIYYCNIQKLIEEGYVEKIRYGYYLWVFEADFSEAKIINSLFPDGILCMDSALFYYRYSDRTPSKWHIAVSKDSGKSRFRIDYPIVKPYYSEPDLLEIGLASGEIDSFGVRIYDRDRTICDVIRHINTMDREIFNKAIQGYIGDPAKNIPNLLKFAKALRIDKKTRYMIGVWL